MASSSKEMPFRQMVSLQMVSLHMVSLHMVSLHMVSLHNGFAELDCASRQCGQCGCGSAIAATSPAGGCSWPSNPTDCWRWASVRSVTLASQLRKSSVRMADASIIY
jgi:hypothetical protein